MSGTRGGRWRRLAVGAVVLAVVVLGVGRLAACHGTLRHEVLRPAAATKLASDRYETVARRYAPWVYHAVHPEHGRQDLPAPVDFDGTLRGDDNWENMPLFPLEPTLYYAALETQTHWFIAYHIFHPRDWSHLRLGVHATHENDGENLQVVASKASGRVVLLFTQAHYCGGVYANEGSGVQDGAESIRGPLVLVDEEGRPSPDGHHPCVYVQAYGHGIYGLSDAGDVTLEADGGARFGDGGVVLRPARDGEAIVEPTLGEVGPYPYRLVSLTETIWPGVRDGTLLGEGGLLDGTVFYEGPKGRVPVPRYYEADRFSGPFGPDRGISPFALDYGFSEGELGSLFFDPARRYKDTVRVPEPWSLAYLDYPFTPADEEPSR